MIEFLRRRHLLRGGAVCAYALLALASIPAAAAQFQPCQGAHTARLAVQPAGFNLHGLEGLPVYALTPGRVRFAGYRPGLGQIIEIDQGGGTATRYAHLDRLLVRPGQSVAQHQEIGLVNDTGWALWPQLLREAGDRAAR